MKNEKNHGFGGRGQKAGRGKSTPSGVRMDFLRIFLLLFCGRNYRLKRAVRVV